MVSWVGFFIEFSVPGGGLADMTFRKTSARLCLFSGVFLAAFTVSGAQAVFVMSIDDTGIVGGGAACVITDNVAAAAPCKDLSGTAGKILFDTASIGNWTVVGSAGSSKPVLGPPPQMTLSLTDATAGSGATILTIALTDTGFTGAAALTTYLFDANGFFPSTKESTTFQFYVDDANMPFGIGAGTLLFNSFALVGDIFGAGDQFKFNFAKNGALPALTDPFSMTIVMNIFTNGATGASYQNNIKATLAPIPGAVWLFGSALLGLFAAGRRRFFGVGKAAAA